MSCTPNATLHQTLLEGARFRHAAKRFDPERKIPQDEFSLLLEIARLSPTSFGLEPWSLVVVQDPTLRERLREVSWGAQGQLPTASHFLVLTALRGEKLSPRGNHFETQFRDVRGMDSQRREDTKAKFEQFAQDDFHLDTPERLGAWAARQSYIVLGNLMSASALLGIDSCPIEGFQQDQVEKVLDGHGGYDRGQSFVSVMLALGYRAQDPHPKSRRALQEVAGLA